MLNSLRKTVHGLTTLDKQKVNLPSSVLVLDIGQNQTSFESYKPIWTLLVVNPAIAIQFDSPDEIRTSQLAQIKKAPKKDSPASDQISVT